jgi:hypothetical protein
MQATVLTDTGSGTTYQAGVVTQTSKVCQLLGLGLTASN